MRILNTLKTVILVVVMISSMMNPSFAITSKIAEMLGVDKNSYVDFKADFVTDLLLGKDAEYVDDESEAFAKVYVKSILVQLMLGNQDETAVTEAFNSLPHSDKIHDENAFKENNLIDKAIVNAMDNENSVLPEDVRVAIKALSNGIYDVHVFLEDTSYEGIYHIVASYLDCDGATNSMGTGVYYDSNTGRLYGHDNKGLFAVGFDYNVKQYVLSSPTNAWQRAFGFNIAYDILGDMVYMDSKTVRVKFKYNGVDMMVQFWMGNYTQGSNGAEIGIYYLEDGRKFHYSCVDEEGERPMSMTLKAKDEEIFTITSEKHWWLAGFKLGPAVNKNDMALDFTIDFLDEEYAKAFSAAASDKGITVEQNGSVVTGIWS